MFVTTTVKPSHRISKNAFYSIMWSGAAVMVFFVGLRLAIRFKVFKKLFWDDAFVILAMLCYVGNAASRSVEPDGLTIQVDIETGGVPLDNDSLMILVRSLKTMLATYILSFCCLWSIKISFLLFFRRLGSRVRGQKIWWWCVLGLTLASLVVCFATIPYTCVSPGANFVNLARCSTPTSVEYYRNVLRFQTGVDIALDLLIISIPVLMLWNVRLPIKQKLGLMSLCSLSVIIIAFAAARSAFINAENVHTPDSAWIMFWSNLECTVSVIIACVGSFRQLFTKPQSQSARSNTQSSDHRTGSKSIFTKFFRSPSISEKSGLLHSRTPSQQQQQQDQQMSDVSKQPHKSIYVSYEVEIKTDDRPLLDRPQQAHYSHDLRYGHRSNRSYAEV